MPPCVAPFPAPSVTPPPAEPSLQAHQYRKKELLTRAKAVESAPEIKVSPVRCSCSFHRLRIAYDAKPLPRRGSSLHRTLVQQPSHVWPEFRTRLRAPNVASAGCRC